MLDIWGVYAAVGIGAGVFVTSLRYSRRHVVNAAFWAVLAAVAGARLLYILTHFDSVSVFEDIFLLHHGGLAAMGAVVGAVLAGVLYARWHRLSIRTLADAAAPGALLAEGITRLGCSAVDHHPGIVTGAAWYTLTGPDGASRHDVGLYLSITAFAGLIIVLILEHGRMGSNAKVGTLAFITLAWYAASRFLLDFLRATDIPGADARIAGFTVAQHMSIGAFILAFMAVVVIYYLPLTHKRRYNTL